MKIMVAMYDVDSFRIIPGKALGRKQTLRGHVIIGQSYNAAVNIDFMPQSCCKRFVRVVAVRCILIVWIDQLSGQGG